MMETSANLLETFKQGQEAVLACVEQIFQQVRALPVARGLLTEFESKLFAHFQYEQEQILPALENFFRGQREIEKKLDFLRYEAKEIKIQALTFFDRYGASCSSVAARNFPIEFAALRRAVIDRIHSEEDHLLPFLEQYVRGKTGKS